jgi:hypothetical protein
VGRDESEPSGAVYARVFGAVGEGQAGEEIRVEANYSPERIRLEPNPDHRWETSFTGLANKGTSSAGRDKPFRSRKLLLGQGAIA